jgi:YVTN family beta-propeller protein
MVPKRVLRQVLSLRYGYLLLCLLAGATGLIGQTNPYVIPVGSVPNALAINPATNQIYVVNSQGATVSVIDGGKLTATPTRVIVGSLPIEAVVNPVTNKIYVANSDSKSVSVIDGANPTAIPNTVTVDTTPIAIAVNRITNTVYVVNKDSNSVSVINGATNTVTNTVTVGLGPIAIG